MNENTKIILMSLAGLIVICGFIYGSYWVAKHVSYALFYEDMVEATVRELVSASALK